MLHEKHKTTFLNLNAVESWVSNADLLSIEVGGLIFPKNGPT